MRLLIAVLLGAVFLCLPASAHDWYDKWCCNGDMKTGDCQMIPASSVKPVNGGYRVTLGPGQHRLVTKFHIWQKRQNEVRYSADGAYHACLFPSESTLRCLYVPPMGY